MALDQEFQVVEKPIINLPPSFEKIYDLVDPRIAQHDHMVAAKSLGHYFSVGASAIRVIRTSIEAAGCKEPRSILDFACGAGRVTRWLKAVYPDSSIFASDIRDADLAFQKRILQNHVWKSSGDFSRLTPPQKFDLVWVGSLFSHLPEASSTQALNAMTGWLNPGGLLIVTFHGRRVMYGHHMRAAKYIADTKFQQVEADYLNSGFGYQDYDNQVGLGFSLIRPQWFYNIVFPEVDKKIVACFEAAWDEHHDVCVIQNKAICLPRGCSV